MDSLQERQQYVLTSGRGVIYCQIYEFGTDLYIGWQSFLNRGLWLEQDVSKGIDKKTGKRIQLKTVISGTQNLTEYDVMDLNCMTEWVHAQMVSITKQLMAERQIDQEIDFKIVRGERGELNPSQANPAQSAPRKGLFKRTG